MKRVIRLTENDIMRLVKKVIREQDTQATTNQTYTDRGQMRRNFRDQRRQLRQNQRTIRQDTRAETNAIAEIKNLVPELNALLNSMNTLGSTYGKTKAYNAFYSLITPIYQSIQAYAQAASNPQSTINNNTVVFDDDYVFKVVNG
jgi:hypothetical protein